MASALPPAPETKPSPVKGGVLGIRFRLLALIIAMQTVMIWWVCNSEIAIGVYLICYSLMMPTALYLLAVRLFRRWLPFSDRELLLSYIVLTATIPIIGFGGIRFIATGMGYLAWTAQTNPTWLKYSQFLGGMPILHDPAAIRGLYLGGTTVPWAAWAGPIAFWSGYLLLLSLVWLGLAVSFRRIWIHQERLTFPVATLPLRLLDARENIFARPVFWVGFAIPAVLQSLMALNYWFPAIPAIQMKAYNVLPMIFAGSPRLAGAIDFYVGFYPMAVGLAYFVPSSVTFSCWFLAVLTKALYVVSAALGMEAVGTASRFPYAQEQGVGAWVALAALVLWGGRRHWRTVLGSVPPAERVAVRRWSAVAVACIGLCTAMMAWVGVPLLMAVGVVLVYVAYTITAARVRAEAGSMWTFAPLFTPFRVTNAVLNTQSLGGRAVVAGGYFDLVHVDIRAMSLPYLMEGMNIAESAGISWRTVLVWVGLATVTALGLGWWRTLTELYTLGAATANTNQYPLVKCFIGFRDVDQVASGTTAWDRSGVLAMLCGGAITMLLAWSRKAGLFGLHPVGYVLSNTLTMNAFIVPFFIAWAAKSLVLRLGGDKLYRRSIPCFVGIILGDITTQALWALAGWVFDVPIYQFLT